MLEALWRLNLNRSRLGLLLGRLAQVEGTAHLEVLKVDFLLVVLESSASHASSRLRATGLGFHGLSLPELLKLTVELLECLLLLWLGFIQTQVVRNKVRLKSLAILPQL